MDKRIDDMLEFDAEMRDLRQDGSASHAFGFFAQPKVRDESGIERRMRQFIVLTAGNSIQLHSGVHRRRGMHAAIGDSGLAFPGAVFEEHTIPLHHSTGMGIQGQVARGRNGEKNKKDRYDKSYPYHRIKGTSIQRRKSMPIGDSRCGFPTSIPCGMKVRISRFRVSFQLFSHVFFVVVPMKMGSTTYCA